MARPSEELRVTPSRDVGSRAFVDVEPPSTSGATALRRHPLDQHNVVGRTQGSLVLDHDTVSRKHAEIFCDPFGRWWVRDVGSTNGTTVNGELVRERVLRPGDRIGVGDFRLRFHVSARAEPPPPSSTPQIEETMDGSATPSWLRTLRDLEPPPISALHLSTLMAYSRRLLSIDGGHERLESLCELLVQSQFHATVAMVLRVEGDAPPRALAGPKRPPHVPGDDAPYVSRSVLRKVIETGEPTLGSNLTELSAGLELTLSAEVTPLATIAVPLHRTPSHDAGDTTDILYANLPPHFGRAEWLALFALAAEVFQQSEISWTARKHAQVHAAIERELETARTIQRALVPASKSFQGLELSVGFEACRWVGGDYVNTIALADGRTLCTVADVCGKGLQAALVTFSIHTMLHALADTSRPLPSILERLNEHLSAYLPEDSFVTMVSVAIDPESGAIEYVNAGHLAPLVFGKAGERRALGVGDNPPLGVAECKLTSRTDRLERGETLLLYTDGITETKNEARAMLGEERLAQEMSAICARGTEKTLEGVAGALSSMIDAFRGEELPTDDRAFLLARRTGP
ncbi:MAG TPA: SpoIIE family protein phosphatase [Polyangiaceae bacterium]|nr:SpoIIE family protein phosphatase [Polyangiaceae bacterium]